MRIKLLLVVWLLTCGLGFGQYVVDFESESTPGTGYGPHLNINLNGINWGFEESLIGDLPNDWKNGNQSARLRARNGSRLEMSQNKTNGLGNISFQYRRYGTDGTQQPWAVEYSTNNGATWTQIGSNITATATVQTFSENVNVTGDVRIRIRLTTTPGTTGDRRMNIDDIVLTDFLGTDPTITVTPNTLTGLDYIVSNGPSAEQTFTVSGSNLTDDIELNAPTGFEISETSGGGFSSTINIPQTAGSVANTTIYTRMISGLTTGNYTGNITATSTGATNQNVTVEGTVIADVVITEIMFDTTGADDEWIEICNFSGAPQDISNYIVNINSGAYTFTFPAGVIIANNDCITVSLGSDGDGTFNNGGCPFVPDFGITANVNDTNNLPNSIATHNISLFAANGSSLADTVDYIGRDNSFVNISLHVINATLDNADTNNGNWTDVAAGGSANLFSLVSPCAVQNIVVRGDIGLFPTIANGDTTPQGTDNTLYAAQTIGNSQDKTFRVANEGSLPLTISAITLSGDTADFTITQLPAFNLAVGTFDILEITFAPTVAGERNATVTITSDDPDTPIYTFAIRGDGNCAVSSPTLSPISGPVGTIVTLTGENFGPATTLTYQGNLLTTWVISSTQLEFEIPTGAISGVVAFNNDLGCNGTTSFTVLNNAISSCEGTTGSAPADIFISEVTDHGTGQHSYIELFNGTGASVNLANYEIRKFNNGASTPTDIITLSGVLANNGVFVVAFGGTDASIQYATVVADLINSSASGINDNDNLRLTDTAGNLIDIWGETSGNTFTVTPKDYSYRRLNTGISAPNTIFNSGDWTALTPADYSNIGIYDFSLGIPPSVAAPVITSTNCLEATITVTAAEGFVGGNSLTYQWFSSAPGDTNWTALTNDAVYSGVTTNTLTINNTFNLNNYQYYCEVRENTATCAQASDAVRINIEQTTWDGSSWSNGVPTAGMVAILDANYTTSVPTPSFTACNLIVNAELNVTDNYYIEVINDALINSGGNIIVETRGAFVQRNDAGSFTLNGGNASLNKDTALKQNWYDYTYWSSPVVNETVENVFPLVPSNRRFYFEAQNFVDIDGNDIDDNANDWQIASGILSPGTGYAATSFNIGPFPRVDQNNFIGAFNNGIIPVPVYRNATNPVSSNNWNFIGNPYPSAIDFVELHNQNSGVIEGAAYLWSQASPPLESNPGNENLNFSQNDYAIINVGSGNVAGGASGGPPSNFIGSAQGFFVNATGNGTVTFNNSMRETGNNTQFFRAPNVIQPDKLWLNLTSDNGVFNQLLVAYVDGATNADDGMYYDAPRNQATGTFASLYSTVENSDKPFAIQGKDPNSLSLNEVIPLGFNNSISAPTVFTISIAQLQGDFMNNNSIYLKDNLLNLTHDLSQSDYNFTAEVGQFNQRFEIVFNRETLSIGDENLTADGLAIIELPNGDVQFIVSQQHQIKEVTIVDLMGRVVYQLKGNHNTETYNLSQLSKAAYIAKVTLANGQTLYKKAVKRF